MWRGTKFEIATCGRAVLRLAAQQEATLMDDRSAESVRLRIVAAIGRDSLHITSADEERHFDGASFVAFYGGQLFLTFAAVAASQFWDKLKEEGAKKVIDVAWEKAAGTLKALRGKGEVKSDAEQIDRIKEASSALGQIGREVEKQYLAEFVAAGRAAVEERLRRDNFSHAKAKRIAAAVAQEVEGKLADG
jgi:hypothetical protein